MKIPFFASSQLFIVRQYILFENFFLLFFQKILFPSRLKNPKNILIFKVGNIGDTICAIPSFIAIRRFYLNAKITLLSSPGKVGAVGAQEFFNSAWYFDNLKIYYSDGISNADNRKRLIKDLKKESYDFFIQLPDDLAGFKTLLRNMVFAKLIGAKNAFGFKIRTVQLFKKSQVDYSSQKSEVLSLLELLKENGINFQKVEYDFPINESQKKKIRDLLKDKWGDFKKTDLIIILNPGAKREANRWDPVNFGEVGRYLQEKYKAKIIIIGSKEDISKTEIIQKFLNQKNSLVVADKLELLELIELLKNASFLISNDTGAGHMAAAVGLPVLGLYCIRNVFGRWLPYGENHEIIYHKFLNCDYRTEECIKKSTDMISVNEIKKACDKIISKL